MGEVLHMPLKKFRKPIHNKPDIRRKNKKGIKRADSRISTSPVIIKLERKKYVKLYHKSTKECKGATPVHDILLLLTEYYINNEFVIHKRMLDINDPSITIEKREKRKRYYVERYNVRNSEVKRVSLRMTKYNKDRISKKMKRDGLTMNQLADLLVDFYLDNQFIIKTKIIRTTRYRTGNPVTDITLFSSGKKCKKQINERRCKLNH